MSPVHTDIFTSFISNGMLSFSCIMSLPRISNIMLIGTIEPLTYSYTWGQGDIQFLLKERAWILRYVHMCMSVCALLQYEHRPEGGAASPGARITGGCELPKVGTENGTSAYKAESALNG